MVFANPDSNTKKATAGLIDDDVVDTLSEGIEDGKGFASVELDAKEFNLTAGAWAKEDLWTGFSYTNKNNAFETWKTAVDKTYNVVDGEVASVDTTTTTTDVANDTNGAGLDYELMNNFSFNLYSKKMEKGAELFWNNNFDYAKYEKVTEEDSVSTAVTSETLDSPTGTIATYGLTYVNEFGLTFSGIETKAKEIDHN